MDRGWVKIWRCFRENAFANKPEYVALWVHMLMLANHTDKKAVLGGKVFTLKPGEFATSRKSLSRLVGISESKVQRYLNVLEIEQQIEQQGHTKFRIISILNWDKYQNNEQQIEQQVNSKRTASEQQVNTAKELKNNKNEKHYKKTDSVPNGTVSSALDVPRAKSPSEEIKEIIDHLNRSTGKQFRFDSKKTLTFISARLKEGFCVDDFYRVIDNKVEKWLGDPKMVDFLRPETLFGTKFESYLNEREARPNRLKGVVSEKTERTINNLNNWSPPNEKH